MTISTLTPEHINRYTSRFNILSNLELDKLRQNAAARSDILPCIQQDTACLLQLIVQLIRPRRVLELGTGIGVSTLIIAEAAEQALITTVERSPVFAAEAKMNFEDWGVTERISIMVGDAVEVVEKLDDTYDLIFQDSGKQSYAPTLDKLVELLNVGGLLIADDTLFPAMELPERNRNSQRVIDKFNHLVSEHPLLESCILPIGHGLTIARKVTDRIFD